MTTARDMRDALTAAGWPTDDVDSILSARALAVAACPACGGWGFTWSADDVAEPCPCECAALVAIVRAAVTPYRVPSVHLTPAQCAQLPAGTEGC